MARKTTQWITFHDDTDEKAIIRTILRDKFSLHALQDEVLYFDKESGRLVSLGENNYTETEILKKFFVHYPDLFCPNTNPQVVVESDGEIHRTNSKVRKRDNARNSHYQQAGLRFIQLRTSEVLQLDESRLEEIISKQLAN